MELPPGSRLKLLHAHIERIDDINLPQLIAEGLERYFDDGEEINAAHDGISHATYAIVKLRIMLVIRHSLRPWLQRELLSNRHASELAQIDAILSLLGRDSSGNIVSPAD